jgi:TRAP-type mannitol/chloroaromatic compound transport system substrate-binding protein
MVEDNMSTKRRSFFKKASATAVAMTAAPTILRADTKFSWRLVMAIPKTLPVWGTEVQKFAEQVRTMSEGRLNIRVYGAGELVPALEVFNTVKAGRVEMGHSAAYYWQGMMPAAPFFTSVPFGLNANGMRSWINHGGGQELWEELYKPHGILPFLAGNTGMQMGGWFNKEIKTMADFKGLKMRIPGLGGKVIAKAGGKPMLVPGGEIFTNLTTGVLDATEWVGPLHDYTMGFYKAAKYYYHPGWHEPGPALELLINRDKWQQLPPDLQGIVRVAATALDSIMQSQWTAKDAEYFAKLKQIKSVQFRSFPQPVLRELRVISDLVKREVAETSPLARRIYDSHQSFLEKYLDHQFATEWEYMTSLKNG